ncbi:MAG: aldehyde dehydrogenase family protein [Verrucomicrobiae bacterium]|nr:aldehyde dehydrogenase family protein [Verrucomicrobiae bacterium]
MSAPSPNAVPHLPCLRWGRSYASLELNEVRDCRSGAVRARVSAVNAGLLRKDFKRAAEGRAALRRFTTAQLLEICRRAGEAFLHATLPLGDQGQHQSPEDYVATLSATSGLPHVLVRRNMQRIHQALSHMKDVLNGLTRGLPAEVLDRGWGRVAGSMCAYHAVTEVLGVVMPSNSPAVNSLWLPAIALKIPVLIKPGREEPWTPYRLIQAFLAAGAPPEAFGFYPTDHEGTAEILRSCGRALLFGDQNTTQPYANDPRIQIHGPGYSKILLGGDEVERWSQYLDLMVSSIADNGGRSCINASAVVVPRHADAIAAALAEKLGPVGPSAPEDPAARLSAFANPKMAEAIEATIEEGLKTPGAADVTALIRQGPRLMHHEGAVYLRPTIVRCESFQHPLANREFLFPYASVVEVPQAEMLAHIGPSLVVTAITRDTGFQQALLDSPLIERLNLGPIPTTRIAWDQPHEGNLFEFLYRRRALEIEELPAAGVVTTGGCA